MALFLEELAIPGRWRRIQQILARSLSPLRRRKGRTAALGILLIFALAVWGYFLSLPPKTTYYIAYVGRYQSAELDPLQVTLLKKYMGTLAGGMQNARFELKTYSIKQGTNTYDSRDAYRQISADPRILAVIDNTWGENLASVIRPIIDNHIAVISMNADRQGEDYKDQVAFIGYDDDVPEKVLAFSSLILRNQKTVIVAEDAKSFPSSRVFLEKLPGVTPLTVPDSVVRTHESTKLSLELRKELNGLPPKARQTVIINTHSPWGNALIDFINSNFSDTDLLGGPYITNRKLGDIQVRNGNRLIIFTRSRDAVTNRVHQEAESITRENQQSSAPVNTDLYLERCLNVVSILEQTISQIPRLGSRGQKYSKEQFATALRKLANEKPFVRNDEVFKFNPQLMLDDTRTFEQHSNRGVSSYPEQLNFEKPKPEVIRNIHVGVDDVQISSIDTDSRTFHANFNYWLDYQGAATEASKYLVFRNLKTGQEKQLVTENRDEGGIRQEFRMSGDFAMAVNLQRFPFDEQEATIQVEPVYPRQQMHVSFDHDHFNHPIDEFGSDEWIKKESYVSVDNVIAESNEGNDYQNYETLNIRTIVQRSRRGAWVTIILPLCMIGIAGLAVLYLDETSFSHVGHVCVVLLLAIGTYRITFPQIIQNSGGWTVADRLFFGTFVVVFVVFLKVIIMNSGMVTEKAQGWMKDRAILVGNLALIVYCGSVFLAVTGWDIRLLDASKSLLK